MTIFFAEVAAFYIAYYTIIMAGYIYIYTFTLDFTVYLLCCRPPVSV